MTFQWHFLPRQTIQLIEKFAESRHAYFFTKPSNYVNLENLVKEFVEKCQLEATMK
jgi:hypothetical protein